MYVRKLMQHLELMNQLLKIFNKRATKNSNFLKSRSRAVPALGQLSPPPPPENYTWAPLSANKVNRKNYTKCDCVQFCVYVP